jgi:hypothetical protein
MAVFVDVFLVQEGKHPNPSGKPYLQVPVSEAATRLGLSNGLPYWTPDNLPHFGETSVLDGVREPRFAVAEVGAAASRAMDILEGFYLLEKTVSEIQALKSQMAAFRG